MQKKSFFCRKGFVSSTKTPTFASAKQKHALLAQLVEQLTLNQWVQGSNPWRCTKEVYLTRIDLFYFSFDLRLLLSLLYRAKCHSDSVKVDPLLTGFRPKQFFLQPQLTPTLHSDALVALEAT